MTYTVLHPVSGEPIGRNLTAWQAAEIVLGYDGREYEVRRVGWGYQLFVSRGSCNSSGGSRGMTEAYAHHHFVGSTERDEAAAREDIGRQVCQACWPGVPQVMTDADYDAMFAFSWYEVDHRLASIVARAGYRIRPSTAGLADRWEVWATVEELCALRPRDS
jgi:hypothetical protein